MIFLPGGVVTAATTIPKLGMLALTALFVNVISNLPTVLGAKNNYNAYQRCLSACHGQYCDGPDLMQCFQRCRQFYGPGL